MPEEFVRARCEETGHIAALPAEALELGMIPGWSAVEGPVPNGPKPAAFPKPADASAPEEVDKTADGESANEDEGVSHLG